MITNVIYGQFSNTTHYGATIKNSLISPTPATITTGENINLSFEIDPGTSPEHVGPDLGNLCGSGETYPNGANIVSYKFDFFLKNKITNEIYFLENNFFQTQILDMQNWNINGNINFSIQTNNCIPNGEYYLNASITNLVMFRCACVYIEDVSFSTVNLENNIQEYLNFPRTEVECPLFPTDDVNSQSSDYNLEAMNLIDALAQSNFLKTGTLNNFLSLNITNSTIDYPNGLTITNPNTTFTDLNGDGKISVKGNVNINSNVNYTINNKTIEFLDKLVIDENNDDTYYSSGFIVNPKARLNLNNCIISSLEGCSTYMWEGIKVKGKYSSGNPGKLYLNNTELKNARTAVSLRSGSFNGTSYYVSGFVSAVNSRFLNNHVSIKFSSPSNSPVSNSIINRCTFTCNNNLNDQVLYNSQGSYAFIQLNSSKGVQILGNTFTGNVNFNPSSRGIGILSYSSSYNVDRFFTNPQSGGLPNIFNNLTKGIDIYASGAATQTIKIKGNGFTNVQQSIKAEGAAFSEISMNSIIVPMSPDPQLPTWGIYLNKCIDYLTTENSIHYQESQNPSTYGIVVVSTTDANQSEIYKNTFIGKFAVGTQVESDNSDLQITCNTYSGEMAHNWAITTNSILDPQGQCNNPDPNFPPAGNVFTPPIPDSDNQIYKDVSSTTFIYRPYANQIPTEISSGITIDPCTAISNINTCPTKIDVYGSGNENGIIQLPPGQVKKALKANKLLELSNAGNIQAIINFLVAGGELQDLDILIPTYLDNGTCNHARAILNAMERPNAEKENLFKFYSLLTDLCESGRTEKDMTIAEKEILQEVVTSETRTSILAEGVFANIDNYSIDRFPKALISARMMKTNETNETVVNLSLTNLLLQVYPNPSKGTVEILFNENVIASVDVIDLFGRVVFQGEINNNSKLTIENLPKGLLTLIVKIDKENVFRKKLTIIE